MGWVPRRIICDKGSAFISKKFVDFTKKVGIKTVYNATATPRANGQVERYNSTILNTLTASLRDEERWDEMVSQTRYAMNSSINATTGKSPYELFFGYTSRAPYDAYLQNAVDVTPSAADTLEEKRKEACERIVNEQVKQKERYDKRRTRPKTYEVGEQVLIRKKVARNDGKSKKTLAKCSGPYVVTKVLPHDRYCIEDLPGSYRSVRRGSLL